VALCEQLLSYWETLTEELRIPRKQHAPSSLAEHEDQPASAPDQSRARLRYNIPQRFAKKLLLAKDTRKDFFIIFLI
jgi:hypothetical protein